MAADVTILPAEPASVPAARRCVRDALAGLGADGAAEDAQTLVSELATNAVLHARTPFTLQVVRRDDVVQVRVADRSAVLPRQRSYGPESTTGRGMRLIASIATAWGIDSEGGGKVVWFELPAEGRTTAVPPWDDETMDVDALIASFDDADGGSDAARAPRAQLRAAA